MERGDFPSSHCLTVRRFNGSYSCATAGLVVHHPQPSNGVPSFVLSLTHQLVSEVSSRTSPTAALKSPSSSMRISVDIPTTFSLSQRGVNKNCDSTKGMNHHTARGQPTAVTRKDTSKYGKPASDPAYTACIAVTNACAAPIRAWNIAVLGLVRSNRLRHR